MGNVNCSCCWSALSVNKAPNSYPFDVSLFCSVFYFPSAPHPFCHPLPVAPAELKLFLRFCIDRAWDEWNGKIATHRQSTQRCLHIISIQLISRQLSGGSALIKSIFDRRSSTMKCKLSRKCLASPRLILPIKHSNFSQTRQAQLSGVFA